MTTDRAQSHTHVHSCVIQSPKGAGDPVPIDGHTEIQNVAHPGSGVLVSPEKGKRPSDTCYGVDERGGCGAEPRKDTL